MLKKTVLALILLMSQFCPDLAFAAEQDCLASYYRTKSSACVDEYLTQLGKMLAANPKAKPPDTIVGFLAELFRTSPQERERVLNAETSEYVKPIALFSLYEAGLTEEAQMFASNNHLVVLSEKLRAMQLTPLDAIRPSSIVGDNDLLIGAYMASGKVVFVQRILDNYTTADDGMAGDAFRIGLMMGKFGKGIAPKGRENVMIQAACTKYQCKADLTKSLRLLTLATAYWSLQSLAGQDDGIKKTLSDFIGRDARLRNLFTAEQAAFGNYLTAILAIAALKPGQAPTENGQAYTSMSKSASTYENLGPAADAFAPFKNLR